MTMRGTRVGWSSYASELVWNHARPSPSTDAQPSYHTWTAHVSRSLWNGSACTWNVREACVFRQMFVEYCTIFACMCRRVWYVSDSSVIVIDMCAVNAWFVSDFYPRHPKNLVNFSTHKHAQTQSVRDLWVIRAWLAVWLALKLKLSSS